MFRRKKRLQAKFCRSSGGSYINITLRGTEGSINLWKGLIEHCARSLSELELEQVITILSREKKAMQKQCNIPQVYEEMLSDLIRTQKKRYNLKEEIKSVIS